MKDFTKLNGGCSSSVHQRSWKNALMNYQGHVVAFIFCSWRWQELHMLQVEEEHVVTPGRKGEGDQANLSPLTLMKVQSHTILKRGKNRCRKAMWVFSEYSTELRVQKDINRKWKMDIITKDAYQQVVTNTCIISKRLKYRRKIGLQGKLNAKKKALWDMLAGGRGGDGSEMILEW